MKFINYNILALILFAGSAQAANLDMVGEFKNIDLNGDGYVTEDELLTYQQNSIQEQNEQIFQAIDSDENGIITENDFISFYKNSGMDKQWAEENLQDRFAQIDRDGNKEITPEEMSAFRESSMSEDNKDLFSAMDADSDGKVTPKEFEQFFALISQLTGM